MAHADELADGFEQAGPRPGDQDRIPSLTRLQLAALRRAAAEREVAVAVVSSREAGEPWSAIGAALGTTGEAARQRYGRRTEAEGNDDLEGARA